IFRNLRKRKPIFYKRTNLITLSQMIFKMKDNARVLFMVAILSAVVLTASGTFYIFFQGSLHNVTSQFPQTFSFVEKGVNTHEVIEPYKVDQILADEGVETKYKIQVAGIPVPMQLFGDTTDTVFVSNQDYNAAAAKSDDVKKLDIAKGHAMFVYSG